MIPGRSTSVKPRQPVFVEVAHVSHASAGVDRVRDEARSSLPSLRHRSNEVERRVRRESPGEIGRVHDHVTGQDVDKLTRLTDHHTLHFHSSRAVVADRHSWRHRGPHDVPHREPLRVR